MSGYLGTKAVTLSTTSATVGGDSTVGGDLTVDTNTLYVDSTNNRVGVGTASPSNPFQVGTSDLIVDSSGNVGIGSSPATPLDVTKAGGGNFVATFQNTTSATPYGVHIKDAASGANGYPLLQVTNSAGSATHFRVDSGTGNISMGSFNASGGSVGVLFDIGGGTSETEIQTSVNGTATRTHYKFINNNGAVGTITTNGTSTAYNTSSDHRLKENVTDVTDGITRVKQLEPKRFNFIADPDKTVDGFLAHQAQAVVPEAVTGTHNEVDDDGNAVMQGIDQSKLVPLLTAALKESIAKIEALEARVTALEGN